MVQIATLITQEQQNFPHFIKINAFLNLPAMKPPQSFHPATPIQNEDPSFPPFDALLENNQTPPHLIVPQTQRSTCSNPSPPPVNPSPPSKISIDLQERPHTLTIATNTHNPQSIIFTYPQLLLSQYLKLFILINLFSLRLLLWMPQELPYQALHLH